MKKLTVLLLLALASVAHSEIYKYVNPVTGAIEYTHQPKEGAVRVGSGETRAEIATDNRAETAVGSTPIVDPERDAALAQIARLFPKACTKNQQRLFCQPAPGMPIRLASDAFHLYPVGYSHTSAGRVDKWVGAGRCVVQVVDKKIKRVDC